MTDFREIERARADDDHWKSWKRLFLAFLGCISVFLQSILHSKIPHQIKKRTFENIIP